MATSPRDKRNRDDERPERSPKRQKTGSPVNLSSEQQEQLQPVQSLNHCPAGPVATALAPHRQHLQLNQGRRNLVTTNLFKLSGGPSPVVSLFDVQGNLVKQNGDKENKMTGVVYRNIKDGNGVPVKGNVQIVNFNYLFYDKISPSPLPFGAKGLTKIYLCQHEFGKGFAEGIQGMKEGGKRIIAVPRERLGQKFITRTIDDYGMFVVELFKVKKSFWSVVREHFQKNHSH